MHRLPADPPIRGHLSDRLAVRDHCQDRLVPLLRHAECPHVRECQASPGTGVKHHPELCKGSAGYVLSRISRISTQDWLGRKDSNLRMADPKSAALPLGDSPVARRSYPGTARTAGFAELASRTPTAAACRLSQSSTTSTNSSGTSSIGT